MEQADRMNQCNAVTTSVLRALSFNIVLYFGEAADVASAVLRSWWRSALVREMKLLRILIWI